MKKLVLVFGAVIIAGAVSAQPGKTPAKPAANPLKNLSDSASYAVGMSVANFYKQQGITNLNTNLVSKAIGDLLANKKSLLDDATANQVLNNYMQMLSAKKAQANIDSGKIFLAKNKLRPGVKTTASGLQYEVITEGTGPKPTEADIFVAHYRGTLLNGTQFDASYDRGQPLEMPLANVIKGWIEGLQLMSVGSKYKLWVPHDIGYGLMDNQKIPGGSVLVFEIELLDVKKK